MDSKLVKKAVKALDSFELKNDLIAYLKKDKNINFTVAQTAKDIKTVIKLRKQIPYRENIHIRITFDPVFVKS